MLLDIGRVVVVVRERVRVVVAVERRPPGVVGVPADSLVIPPGSDQVVALLSVRCWSRVILATDSRIKIAAG